MKRGKLSEKSGKRGFEAESRTKASVLKGKEYDVYEKHKKAHGPGLY